MWFFSSASNEIRSHVASRDRALCINLPANDEHHPTATKENNSQFLKSNLDQLDPNEIEIQPGDEEILRCDISGLTEGIKNKKWTSTRILCAFIRSARRAQRDSNCLTEGEPYRL